MKQTINYQILKQTNKKYISIKITKIVEINWILLYNYKRNYLFFLKNLLKGILWNY